MKNSKPKKKNENKKIKQSKTWTQLNGVENRLLGKTIQPKQQQALKDTF